MYIKLDKKLIVDIEEIKLLNDSKVKNSYEDLQSTIQKIPTVFKFFERIDIESLVVDGNHFKILVDKDHLYLDNKFVNVSSTYSIDGNNIDLNLYSLLLKDVNLLLRGSVNLDYRESKASFYGNYLLQNRVEGELNTHFSKQNIEFFVTTQKVKNIKFLRKLFRLDKIAEAWMYDNVTGDMQLNYLYGKLNPETFEPILDSIKGEALIKNAQITFNKKVAPVKTSKLTIFYENDTLKFDLYKPKYKHLSIDGSKVEIPHLTSEAKGRVDVLIQTKEILGDEILGILKAYDINLPIKQISGKTDAHVLLKIPYVKPMQTFGNFLLSDSKLLINNSFEFYSKHANVELKNMDVIVKSSHFEIKDLLDSTIDLTIDINKLNAKGMATINKFLIENNKKDVINLNKVKTALALDFTGETFINLQDLKTKIVLNEEFTEVNIDKIQLIEPYSTILKENNIKNGNLKLHIYDENNIKFDGTIIGLDVPIKKDDRKVDTLDIQGELLNKNVLIESEQKDIRIDIKPKEPVKITLDGYDIFPLIETNNTISEQLNVHLLNSAIYLKDETYHAKDVNVVLKKEEVQFSGLVDKIDLPLLTNGKRIRQMQLSGTVKENFIEVISDDKNFYLEILNETDYTLRLNKIDLQYNTNDTAQTNEDIKIIGTNSNIIINDKFKVLSTKYDFILNKSMTKFDLYHNKTNMNYYKDEEGLITINARNVSDVFINSFFQKDFVQGGNLEIEATGKDHIITGRVNFKENKLKNLRTLNNIIILVNTSPGLVNPFLAIPSIFGMVTSDGFNVNGYKVNKGYVDFTYNFDNKFLNMYSINTEGNSVDFDGFATFDFDKDIVHSDMKLIFMKGYSSAIDVIPGLDYILLGDDKQISTLVNIRGSIENPDIKTNVLKDSAMAPLDVIKRIFTLPLKPFLD